MATSTLKALFETAQMNRLITQLLSNETFLATMQSLVSRTLAAKGSLDKSLRGALATMNLPSTGDVESLRKKLDDLDRTITELDAKFTRLEAAVAAPKPAKKAPAGAKITKTSKQD
jgi:glycine cleavage system regulatory protein